MPLKKVLFILTAKLMCVPQHLYIQEFLYFQILILDFLVFNHSFVKLMHFPRFVSLLVDWLKMEEVTYEAFVVRQMRGGCITWLPYSTPPLLAA